MALTSHEYLGEVLAKLTPLGEISVRRVLGGYGLYRRGIIFGIIAFDELYFKVGEKNREEYKVAGSSPLIFPGKQTKENLSYRSVPDHVMNNRRMLEKWVRDSCEVSAGVPMAVERRARFKVIFQKVFRVEIGA